ncbi:MAG: hypothetical protein COA52_00730 [Hyphomicrobiales bacterium]|nr:MAG: hypothetical protein COA52_00730 [Hyphomicrobiales bacterium]
MNIENIKTVIKNLKMMGDDDFDMSNPIYCIAGIIRNIEKETDKYESTLIKSYFAISFKKALKIYAGAEDEDFYEKATRKIAIKMLKRLIKTNKVKWKI